MKKLLYILLFICSFSQGQNLVELDRLRQTQYQYVPPTPFEDYYNLVANFGADNVSTFDQQTSWSGIDYDDWVHPCVNHYDAAWNGHSYWMAITGYGATQGVNENPYLFYSDDGETWLTPAGAPAPLHTSTSDGITDTAYLSDTFIQMVGTTLYIFNRGNLTAGGSYWEYVTTTDGVNFSARTRIISADTGHADYVSCSILLIDGEWYMFGTDITDTGKLAVLRPTPATSLTGTWSEVNRITSDSGALWHTEVHYSPDDLNFYVLGSTNGANGGDLMFGKFSDINAVSMETRNTFLNARGLGVGRQVYYKSSFIIKGNAMELFLGTKGDAVNSATGWRVQRATTSRLSPSLDLTGYTLTNTYALADAGNGFSGGLKNGGSNKMLLQATITDPANFYMKINSADAQRNMVFSIDVNTLAFLDWKSGTINYTPNMYGIKTDDVVTLLRDETNLKIYVNSNLIQNYTLPSGDFGAGLYTGMLFGGDETTIKDLKVYKKPEWINYTYPIATILADAISNPTNYILADDFNRASLGTTDLLGNTYAIPVGTPSISSNQLAINDAIIGIATSETNVGIYSTSYSTIINWTDINNYRYLKFQDIGSHGVNVYTVNSGTETLEAFISTDDAGTYGSLSYEIRGNDLIVVRDNIAVNDYTLAANANPRWIGVKSWLGTSGTMDNLVVSKLLPIIPDTEAPTAPTSLVASNVTDTTVDLNWTAATDNGVVVNYKVYNSGVLLATVGSAVTSYTVTDLTPETAYILTVRAIDAFGNEGTDSNSQSFTTDVAPTLPPYTYSDDFNDNTLNTSFWSIGSWAGGSGSETTGQIVIIPSNGGGSELSTNSSYSLVGKQVWAEIKEVPNQAINTGFWFGLYNGTNSFEINSYNGTLVCSHKISGSNTVVYTTTYNSSVHKWLRLREDTGTLYYEYSTDGITWNVFFSESNPITMTSLQFKTGAESLVSGTLGTYKFDNFYGF